MAEDADGPKSRTGHGRSDDMDRLARNKRKSNEQLSEPEGKKATSTGKISMSFTNKVAKKPVAPVKMSIGGNTKSSSASSCAPGLKKTRLPVASAFQDESSDEEEMPAEAKMRMRNLGKHTQTAAGPNSFGKGNLGFCDRRKILERELQQQLDDIGEKG